MNIKARTVIEKLNRIKDIGSNRRSFIRLDKNERTIPFPEEFFRKVINSITPEDLISYADQTPLYEALFQHTGFSEENLLLTAGSDAALKIIFECFLEPSDKVIILDPTYAMVNVYLNLYDSAMVKIGFDDDMKLDFESLLNSVDHKTKMMVLANPNQPTGTMLSDEEFVLLADRALETNCILVIDEAYIQFSGRESSIHHVKKYPNLIVTQTFSKGIGMAGIRLGFVVAHPSIIGQLYKIKSLMDINILAIRAGCAILENYELVESYVNDVITAREFLKDKLTENNLEFIDSHTNFIHIKFPKNSPLKEIAAQMKAKGYLIRTTGDGLPAVIENCIRITVGPLEQMRQFLKDFLEVAENCR